VQAGELLDGAEIIYRAVWPVRVRNAVQPVDLGPDVFVRKMRSMDKRDMNSPKGREPGLSVARANMIDPDGFVKSVAKRNFESVRVAKAQVSKLSELGFKVVYTPNDDKPWHSSIRCLTCNMELWDCILADGADCKLNSLVDRSKLADLFQPV
jgi:hypothetical protein